MTWLNDYCFGSCGKMFTKKTAKLGLKILFKCRCFFLSLISDCFFSSFIPELNEQLLLPPLAAGCIALGSVFAPVFILELLQSDSVPVQPCKPPSCNQCVGISWTNHVICLINRWLLGQGWMLALPSSHRLGTTWPLILDNQMEFRCELVKIIYTFNVKFSPCSVQ